MTTGAFHGHHFRSRQPSRIIGAIVSPPADLKVPLMDAWLQDVFEVAPEYRPIGFGLESYTEGSLRWAAAVLSRVLLLYCELMRAAGVPVFDHGRVLEIAEQEGDVRAYRARISLPVIDNENPAIFVAAFRTATNLAFENFGADPDGQRASISFERAQTELIEKIKTSISFLEQTRESTHLAACLLAYRHEIPFRHLGQGIMRMGWGAKSRLIRGGAVEQDSAIGASICHLKHLTASFLKAAGLPGPEHLFAPTFEDARKAAEALGWPVVVKPTNSERSLGVSIDIFNQRDLAEAYRHAKTISEAVLVERQAPGFCHRIMLAGGQVASVARRKPKGLRGDGMRTVRELAAAANQQQAKRLPWKRLKAFPLDDIAEKCLSLDGLTFDSVPAEGQWARLRPITSDEWGGDVDLLTDSIHPQNVELARTAARLIGLTNLGMDLITTDITRPWQETGAIVNELNAGPQFFGWNSEVAAPIMLRLLAQGDGRIPVHFVTGNGDLLSAARAVRERLSTQGQACHIIAADCCEDSQGRSLLILGETFFARVLALVLRPDVEGLIIAGCIEAFETTGFPIDKAVSIHILGRDDADAEQSRKDIARCLFGQEVVKIVN